MPRSLRPTGEPTTVTVPLPGSPRAAAEGAMVYRRRLREVPRERLLRVAGWVGTLLIHFLSLMLFILGPAYDTGPPPPEENAEALQVRLIDKTPPPIPPIRGTPAKAPAKTRKSVAASSTRSASRRTTVSSATPALPVVAIPPPSPPQVKPDTRIAAPSPSVAVAPERPVVQSTAPPPQPELQAVPKPEQAPPDLAIDTPLPKVVPPAFQPEPVRKPQAEGTVAMPPPPSLAIPPTPASQPQLRPTPPTLVADSQAKVATTAMTIASVPRPEVVTTAAEPTPQLEPLPRVAPEPTAPAVDTTLETPTVPREVARAVVQVQTAAPEQPAELAAVPVADMALPPTVSAPSTSAPERAAIAAPTLAPGAVERPVDDAGGASAAIAEAAATEAGKTDAGEATAATNPAGAEVAGETTSSGAADNANATAEKRAKASSGEAAGRPGVPSGSEEGTKPAGANGTSTAATGTEGKAGEQRGSVADFIQLKPRGNTEVTTGDRVHIDYKATRFDNAWTPKGESSVDTAVRHGVEAVHMGGVIPLPRGVRMNCGGGPGQPNPVMEAISIFSFGCSGDPPAKGMADQELRKVESLPSANPLVTPEAPMTTVAVASPLDNSTMCATARVAGGPLPPGCEADTQVKFTAPKAGDSWVPASDQFK